MAGQFIQIEMYTRAEDEQLASLRWLVGQTMQMAALLPSWNEYYEHYPNLPRHIRKGKVGSLFIDEKLVWHYDSFNRWPEVSELSGLIQNAAKRSKRSYRWRAIRKNLSFLLALIIAFFPKCPFCWAAYLSAFGLSNLAAFTYQAWMLPVFAVLLLLNLFSLFLTRKTNQLGPFFVGLMGAMVIVLNRFVFNVDSLIYAGSVLLIAGALWNSLSVNMIASLRAIVKWR